MEARCILCNRWLYYGIPGDKCPENEKLDCEERVRIKYEDEKEKRNKERMKQQEKELESIGGTIESWQKPYSAQYIRMKTKKNYDG